MTRPHNKGAIIAPPTSCPPICYDNDTCNIFDDGGHVAWKTRRKHVHVRNIRRNTRRNKNPECDLLQLFNLVKIGNKSISNYITHILTTIIEKQNDSIRNLTRNLEHIHMAINEKPNDSIGNLTRNLEPALFEIKRTEKNKHQALSRKFIELPFRKR